MNKKLVTVAMPIALLTTQLAVTSTTAAAADTLGESFSEGKAGYSLRWRLENVDQDPLPNEATAIPLRARINFHTADLYGFSAKAEFDYVFNFGVDDFNAGGSN